MTDNPHPSDAPRVALHDHAVVALEGRDALAFAQAQAMNDVAALGDGQWQWNGWLTPKGRLIALFALLRRDAQAAWLLVPDGAGPMLAEGLRRYLFRSKLAIALREDLHVSGAFAAHASASGAQAADEDGGVALDFTGAGGARTAWIGTRPGADDADALARWRAADLAHGLPRLGAAQRERWTPQQLSLERLRAFSVKKGCYPGQEIVARTHFLGQAKRGLALLHADAPVAPGAEVRADGAVVGEVASVAEAPQVLALAVLQQGVAAGSLEIAGVAATPHSLLDGLAR